MGRLSLRLAGETPVDAYVRTCGRVDVRQADAGDLSAIGTSRIGLRESVASWDCKLLPI